MVRESHIDKMAFEQRPEGSEGISHANSWGKDFQTEGIESKGPESEACWTLRGIVRNPVWLTCIGHGEWQSRSGR